MVYMKEYLKKNKEGMVNSIIWQRGHIRWICKMLLKWTISSSFSICGGMVVEAILQCLKQYNIMLCPFHCIILGQFSFQSQRRAMPKNVQVALQLNSITIKIMLKILQVRLQKYMNRELSDVQAGFRKGRGTRYQVASIHWIMEKAREFQKNICFIDYAKAFDCVDHSTLWNILEEM